MLNISNGHWEFETRQGVSIKPFLSREEFQRTLTESNQDQQENIAIFKSSLFIKVANIEGHSMLMEVHFDRNDLIDRVTLRAITKERSTGEETSEAEAIEQKKEHDLFLTQVAHLPIGDTPNSIEKEIRFDASWGSITSTLDLTETPEARIIIRYRNIKEDEKDKYLKLGKEKLHGQK